jgi:zinc transport system ATP-binding protein
MAGEKQAETMQAIELQGVDFSYGNAQILQNVSFNIDALDSVCIVGPNGGGKTTLVKLILGLLHPDRGSIRVFGRKPEEQSRRIGYVPQYVQYDAGFPIPVHDVVAMGRLGHSFTGRYSKKDKQKITSALEAVQLEHLADHSFAALSGGQRQRVLIARALAAGGDILILDEPTANIDHESEQLFFELLGRLNKQMTILMVTHEVGFASTFFKRIICVNRQVFIHPTSELTGELIQNMYGGDLQMIRHDHRCSAEGHQHD